MYKIISSNLPETDEPTVSIIDVNSSMGMFKSAADSKIMQYAAGLTPEEGKTYIHLLALGASEWWSSNRNGDFFPEDNLKNSYKTFETNKGRIHLNHQSKDPNTAVGKVLLAIYNDRMHRVELVAELWNDKVPHIISRINNGEYPSMSMGVRTAFDTCSICGNKAKTRQEYCTHLRNDLGKMYSDGRKVAALNNAPLSFYEQSFVVRGADPTSSVLQKLAFASNDVVSSAEMAEIEGLFEDGQSKIANLSKLSEFLKEVQAQGVGADSSLDKLMKSVQDPDVAVVKPLAHIPLEHTLHTMAELGINPSLEFLAELIGRQLGSEYEGVGEVAAAFIKQVTPSKVTLPSEEFTSVKEASHSAALLLKPYMAQSSLMPEFIEKRAFNIPIYERTNVGYIGNGPHIEPTPFEKFQAMHMNSQGTPSGNEQELFKLLKALLHIGGTALAAKWYITKTIEEKMKQQAIAKNNSPVKIVLIKAAADTRLTVKLSNESLKRSLLAN